MIVELLEFLKMHPTNTFLEQQHAAMDNIAIAKYLIEKGHDIGSIAGINQNYAWGKDSWKDFSVSIKKLSLTLK